MTRQKFDLMELDSQYQSSTGALIREPKSQFAWRKILLIAIAVALLAACVVGLVFGLKNQPESPKSTTKSPVGTPRPPKKQSWLDDSCSKGRTRAKCPWKQGRSNPLLIVMMDGFHAEYVNRNVTPVIQRLIDCGVHTSALRPVYPSLTFPNDQTIVTGLYPESHGIVDNDMYDHIIGEEFKIRTRSKEKPEWWGGEPVWVTAKKQGKRSATFIWPMASTINISGILPDLQVPFKPSLTAEMGVDQVVQWLELPEEERPDFLTLYSTEPDKTGHRYGPQSEQVVAKLKSLNSMVLKLMDSLYERDMEHCVNIMFIADHGMTSTSCERKEYLECYTNVDDVLMFDGTIGRISTQYRRVPGGFTKNTQAPSPNQVATDLECRSDHYKVFLKNTLPSRFHYAYNDRIGDVIVDIEDGWLVYRKERTNCPKGSHGYDNQDKAMQALFVGYGPSFKENVKVSPFENIELYNLMCDLMGITPAPNNGTNGALHHLLRNPPELKMDTPVAVPHCPVVDTSWTGLQSCACSESDQRDFISRVTTTNGNSKLGLDPPTYYKRDDMCNLHQTSHSTGFSHTLHMARWVATGFTSHKISPNMSDSLCIIPDNRLTVSDRSAVSTMTPDSVDIVAASLLPENYLHEECGDLVFSSTLLPMYFGFQKGIWQYVWEVAHSYAESEVSVTVGPIFDHDHDGHPDTNYTIYADTSRQVPMPSHFFMLVVRCKNSSQTLPCDGNIDTLAFILPHTQSVPNCLDYKSYLEDNVVRVRDLELLTGLHFLDQFPVSTSITTRLNMVHELWPSNVCTRQERNRTQNAPEHWIDWTCPAEGGSCQSDYQPVLLVAADGFAAEFINNNVTPVIKKLMQHGVHSPAMRPVYPTLTFPNMYSIITGLYPESHGIVDNSMFDAIINKEFYIGGPFSEDARWWGGVPMWQNAKQHGKRSATYFWVGSDTDGVRPDYYVNYSKSDPFTNRVDTVLEWMTLPKGKRPDFITLYFSEPDTTGHDFNPEDTTHMNPVLKQVDDLIGRLMDGLYKLQLHNCVNLILIADHGMTPTPCDQKEDLACYTNTEDVLIYDGPAGRIVTDFRNQPPDSYTIVKNDNAPPVSQVASDLECRSEHFKVYVKETVPARLHYTYNTRIGDIVLNVQDGWGVRGKKSKKCLKGNHGYDNLKTSMQALFVAHGPAFKRNVEVAPFENIELYNLMCDLLEITPASNNGTYGALHHLLKNPPSIMSLDNATDVQICPDAPDDWTGLQHCSCSAAEQQAFINSITEVATTPSEGLDSPTLYISDDMCRLQQRNYVTGYSHTLHTARWVAVTLTSQQNPPNISDSLCVIPDNRLTMADRSAVIDKSYNSSTQSNITRGNLLPDNYMPDECGDMALSSTLVPMYTGFKTGIWQFVWETVYGYTTDTNSVSVTVGPIFERNHDGHVDTNLTELSDVHLPSHFYVLLARCKISTKTLPCDGNIDTLAFVLPHTHRVPNCLDYKSYLEDNVVRIRDLELLTGLHFLDQFPIATSMATRLNLVHELWPSSVSTREESPRVQSATEHWMNWTCSSEGTPCQSDYRPVVLISLDGFRADYLSKNVTPVIKKLIKHGVHTHYMRPVYPTYTYPNHYTLITGLYPESHGIIGNKMFDIQMNKSFNIGTYSSRDTRWWGGEPMWLTSQRQGKKSASYFWVGSDIEIQGGFPNYYRNYSNRDPFVNRINTVLDWLSLPEGERPDFITLYFNEPDSTGHKYGPDDTEHLNPALKEVDNMIGKLMEGLYKKKLHNCVNLIVLADHGMTPRSCDRAVALDDVLFDDDMANMAFYTSMHGRISNKYSRIGKKYTIHDPPVVPKSKILDRLHCLSPHMRTYEKEQLPKRHHYVNNHRIDDIVMDVDNEWIISRLRNPKSGCSGASHGEDNIYASEGALFLAHGPAFKEGLEVEPFENIEIYNLIADVLDIKPAPNNGTKGALYHLLKNPPKQEVEPTVNYSKCMETGSDLQTAITRHCNCSRMPETQPHFLDLPAMSETSTTPPCQTVYGHYVSVFSSELFLPRWSSVYLNSTSGSVVPDNPGCIVPDPNLSQADREAYQLYENSEIGVTATRLVTSMSSSCGSVSLSSSLVPMYTGFKEGMWKYTWTLIDSYLDQFGELQVTAGPIWDYEPDGVYEGVSNNTRFVDTEKTVILPTHFFLVVAKCRSHGDRFPCTKEMDILPLILPHTKSIPTCEIPAHYVFENVARLRDIELLTGLKFFSKLSMTTAISLRTFLPTALWDSPLLKPKVENTGSWMNHTCETEEQAICTSDYKPLVLISLDGFRADYLQKFNVTPVIQRLSTCGVHTPFMKSVYPTKTFPNHFTIVTGLYPEAHGIIDNNMYDLGLHQKFSISSDNKLDPRWWHGEPIWETLKKAGKKSASFFWPGSDIKANNPNYFKRYLKGQVKFNDRVDVLLYWMTRPADRRPDLLTLYMDEPDYQAHADGPDDEKVQEKLAEVDAVIGYLMDALYRMNLHNCVNIILLADHGMAKKSCQRMVSLRSHFSSAELNKVYVYDGPFGRISNKYTYGSKNNNPLPQPLVSKETILNRLQCKSKHLRVYDKTLLPVRHHYVTNNRIDDIILDVDDKWLVSRSGSTSSFCRGGDHGYDTLYLSMGALFLAHGPAFKQRFSVDTFENIELYNLMTTILDVTPAPNNGTRGSLNHMLRNPPVLQDMRYQHTYQNCSGTDDSSTFVTTKESTCSCNVTDQVSDTVPSLIPSLSVLSTLSTCMIQRGPAISVYSPDINMPLWASTTITQNQANMTVYPEDTVCVFPDLLQNPEYRDTHVQYNQPGLGVTVGSLVPGLNDSCVNARPSSLVVPMYDAFRTGLWRSLWKLISEYGVKYGTVTVTAGPVFDYNSDGRYEGDLDNITRYVDANETVPFPTHFFAVISLCNSSLPCTDDLKILPFILPHQEESPNCLDDLKQLLENTARVRDIELITGLRFFDDLPVEAAARLATFSPTQLWDAPAISGDGSDIEWKDMPCPDVENNTCSSSYKPLLLIALDGFRADYLSRGVTPVLQRLLDCGSHSEYMRPVYPSKTFPNMYTIVTGLYPESHGVVDNTMYDKDMGKKFRLGGRHMDDTRWWGGEPLWLTAKSQGKKTASYFWVGSDIEINGTYPDMYRQYSSSVPYTERIETVVQWLTLPEGERPEFVSLYFSEPDVTSHDEGPSSDEVDETLEMLDEMLGLLMDLLLQKNLHNCVNIIITADHGMAPTECDRLFLFSNFYTSTELRTFYVYEGAFSHISNTYKYVSSDYVRLVDDPRFSLTEIADKLRCNNSHIKVWYKNDIPRRLHYANNDRIEGLYFDVSANWTASRYKNTRYCQGGTHGYDNVFRTMNALFLAYGPAFKINTTIGPFENIELYNMMADVLNITAAPNNGTQGLLNPILRSPRGITREPGRPYETTTSVDTVETLVNRSVTCDCPLTVQEASSLRDKILTSDTGNSLPFGIPFLRQSLTPVQILNQPYFVTGYSTHLQQPLWVSYTVNHSMLSISDSTYKNCSLPDPRVPSQSGSSCDVTVDNYTDYTSIIPKEFHQPDDNTYQLSTVTVPMLKNFTTGIWSELYQLVSNWTRNSGEVNILSGPIFDDNHSGQLDDLDLILDSSSIPSDFFTIVTRCSSPVSLTSCSTPDVLVFILSHTDTYTFNCQNVTAYLQDHVARVRDVELLTGLELFTRLPVQQSIQLRTAFTQTQWNAQTSS